MTTVPALFSLLRELCALRVLCVKSFSSVSRVAVPILLALFIAAGAPAPQSSAPRSHLGFDRNIYPGDDALPILRKTFSFASYWLSPPPGEKTNTWSGKRELIRKHGFGFVVLFRGREEKDLKGIDDAAAKGELDARAAVEAARREGFSPQTIIYLDIEEGGRLSPKYHKYIIEWLWHVSPFYFRGGFYCSGIPLKEDKGKSITTCEDIIDDLAPRSREFSLWAFNDVCPPSPGCAFPENPPAPSASGISYAAVWQFAQSPRRKERTAHCPAKYAPDGNCYAPNDTAHKWFLDVNTATSADPSSGAK